MTIIKTSFIQSLPIKIQNAIRRDITNALSHTDNIDDITFAMNGRLCDIEELIDINQYITD